MKKSLAEPLDDEEFAQLDEFLLNRIDDETGDRIAAAGGDEGILDVSGLDGFLTALASGPNVIVPSRWLPAMWGAAEPSWQSTDQFQGDLRAHRPSSEFHRRHAPSRSASVRADVL